jgi:hypothetical protein
VGPGTVWTGAEKLASTGIRSPDRQLNTFGVFSLLLLSLLLLVSYTYLVTVDISYFLYFSLELLYIFIHAFFVLLT